jgi:sugar phosphate isomerase/epimerase
MRIAAELSARHVVFHANYLPFIHHPNYRPDWTRRQVAFWRDLIRQAERLDLIVALENMWEPEPGIIADVLEQVDSPHLCACLDVGHVHLYSDSLPIGDWIARLKDHLVHCHINNPRGLYDEHLSLNAKGGVIDYDVVIPMLEALQPAPLVCLEMDELEALERSLHFLGR